ncbi:MAG TPA: asparagine synthase-related protein [Byssovorax sp.]|jgi:asparagine synthase (glutamine-hydrolysing)
MSAIAVAFNTGGAPADAGRVAAMLAAAPSRCPDGTSVVVDGPCALGHGLLATLPEDAPGAQPLRFERDRVVFVTADARVDNRRDLAASLDLDPGAPDAEFIAAAYLRWGDGCAERLIGDFAFAIWDPARRTVYAARDPFGARRLYTHERPGLFACASDKRALLTDADVSRELDTTSVGLFLLASFRERDRTLFASIRALEPGHSVVVTADGSRRARFWRPDPFRRIERADDRAYADELRATFDEAVRARLRSARPIAANFSGGLDSTSIVASARRLAEREGARAVVAYRACFPDVEGDETGYASAAADHLGIDMHQIYPLEMLEAHRPSVERGSLDHLFLPGSVMLELLIAAGRQGSDAGVFLTGMGGDQLLRPTDEEELWHLGVLRLADARAEAGSAARLASLALRRAARSVVPMRVRLARHTRSRASGLWEAIAPELRAAFLNVRTDEIDEAAALPAPDRVQRAMAAPLLDDHNIGWVLSLAEAAAAHFGVEHRHPFLDRRVVELLLAVPHRLRHARGVSKGILRTAMQGDLPPVLLRRPDKMSFNAYVARSTFEPHRSLVQQYLLHGQLIERGFVDPTRFRSWVTQHLSQRYCMYACTTLALELWLRHLPTSRGHA